MTKSVLVPIIACCAMCFGCGGNGSVPPPVADFSISVSPASVSTQVGGTTMPVTVSLNAQNGFTGAVTVSISGFPNGINSSPAAPFMLSPGTTQQVTFQRSQRPERLRWNFKARAGRFRTAEMQR
jgi:hypothetical protein